MTHISHPIDDRMELAQSSELNEFNRILLAVVELGDHTGVCSLRSVRTLCSSIVLGGRPVDYRRLFRLSSHVGLLHVDKGMATLTEAGREFLVRNPDAWYEITDAQRRFLADQMVFRGPWRAGARNLLLRFYPSYSKMTYELNLVETPLAARYNAAIELLTALGILEKAGRRLWVTPAYVAPVRQLLVDYGVLTEAGLEQALAANRKLADQAEENVVVFEQERLIALGRQAEAEMVRRISQLDVCAGYDIESFDGRGALLDYDRFSEGKASLETELRFFWSANERRVAEQRGDSYWIYFVGGCRHKRSNRIEPIMIQNPARRISQMAQLTVEAASYLVTQSGELRHEPARPLETGGFVL